MTVSSADRVAGPFLGNGVATTFDFEFKTFNKADLTGVLTLVADGTESTLVLDSDYSVLLNADQNNDPGGTITYPLVGVPMPATYELTISSNVSYAQATDITNLGGFFPQVIEDALDYVTMLTQQLHDVSLRSLQYRVSDTARAPVVLMPVLTDRISKTLVFDANGDLTAGDATTLGVTDSPTFIGLTLSGMATGHLVVTRAGGELDDWTEATFTDTANSKNIKLIGSASTMLGIELTNSHASGDTRALIEAQGTGDAWVSLIAGTSWYAGVDNSQSDRYAIGVGGAVGASDWLQITTAGAITIPGTLTLTSLTNGRFVVAGASGLVDSVNTFTYTNTAAIKEFLFSGSASGALDLSINNSHASADAYIAVTAQGTGDVYLNLTAGSSWIVGVDNSQSDRFAIGTGTLGSADVLQISTAGAVTIPNTLTVTGASALNGAVTLTAARFNLAQGATVVSTNNLALGTDGNRFQISGNTQINLLNNTSFQGGSRVTLHFQSTPTVKHNQAASGANKPIMLLTGADFVATANDQLTLEFDSIDIKWYEVGRVLI